MSDNKEEELVSQVYGFALELRKSGKNNDEIRAELIEKGLEKDVANTIVSNLDNLETIQKDDDSGAYGWLIWIGILIVVNVLSAMFDWPFWIY